MQNLASSQFRSLRVFRVGVMGVTAEELSTINRVCSVTQYRVRRYQPVHLSPALPRMPNDIDILILGQSCDQLSGASGFRRAKDGRQLPVIQMVRSTPADVNTSGYVVKAPVNPSKFLRTLDQYTIKELNYFPEFEIGDEFRELKGEALDSLRMLTRNAAATMVGKANLTRNKALVVDDSLAVRRQMEIEFQLLNERADVVSCAEVAMQAIKANRYSIIFLDVIMPGMDGYAACKKIKRSPLNHDTPVVMLTSRSSSFDKFKGTLAGCDAYLVKPINHNEFEQVFKNYARLDNSSLRQGDSVNGSK